MKPARMNSPSLRGETGMTLAEIAVVIAILGAVLNLAVPGVDYAMRRARATSIVNDFEILRSAAVQYYADKGSWPKEYVQGFAPPELSPYMKLTNAWADKKLGTKYDWENWTNAKGKATKPGTGVQIGFSVVTTDQKLVAMIKRVYGPGIKTPSIDRITFVIDPVVPATAKKK